IDKNYSYNLNWDNDSLPSSCEHHASGGWVNSGVGPTLKSGQWYHLACTYNGTLLRYYINGVLSGSATVGAPTSDSRPVYIGARSHVSGTGYFDGAIDDVRIYNRALSL